MKIITSTHYNRPTCTIEMLDHLAECKGIEDYKIICCVEPVNDVIPTLIEAHPLNTELVVNDRILGLWANKKKALSLGFSESDYVIHVEDDILLSKDSLSMFEFCYGLGEDTSIFTVTGFGPRELGQGGECVLVDGAVPDDIKLQIRRHKWYTPWGWATWKDRWDSFKDEWDGHDQVLNRKIRGDRFELFPTLSRVKSIGYRRGEYTSASCDDEMFRVIRDNPKVMSAYKCKNEQEVRDSVNEHRLKMADGVEILKRSDSNAGTKCSTSFKKGNFWAGDYEIPESNFELTWDFAKTSASLN
jgi:hypothetical protein